MAELNSIRSNFYQLTFLADAFRVVERRTDDEGAAALLACLNHQFETTLTALDAQLVE